MSSKSERAGVPWPSKLLEGPDAASPASHFLASKKPCGKRVRASGFGDRIEIKLMDYRSLPVPSTPYDKIVSIEMLEAVGQEYLATYFACVNRLLKKHGGIAMFQCITMPENRHEAYSKSEE